MRKITILLTTLLALSVAPPALAEDLDDEYAGVVESVAELAWDDRAWDLVSRFGLDLVNVAWEDTGRYQGSSVGPNISDVTIQVQYEDPFTRELRLALMPVVRHPNFSDITADLDLDDFHLLVGNERGADLRRVTLREYLGDFRRYLSDPDSWAGRESSLLAERDDQVLVSAQAAFLPIPREGIAEFNPVIFNYQSYEGDPAVLTIVATREGTSATIIDNVRDGFPAGATWGQRLFFNHDGERASFTGQRLSDFTAEGGDATSPAPEVGESAGLNMVLVIQVPLRQKNPLVFEEYSYADDVAASPPAEFEGSSDVEEAVIGHGEVEGPFTEIDGIDIERDERFPIRVTVQFYQATSNGVVTEDDVAAIAETIDRVYDDAEFVGSLVVDGDTGRSTHYDGPQVEPPGWWAAFWERHEANTGLDRADSLDLWNELRALAWRVLPAWMR